MPVYLFVGCRLTCFGRMQITDPDITCAWGRTGMTCGADDEMRPRPTGKAMVKPPQAQRGQLDSCGRKVRQQNTRSRAHRLDGGHALLGGALWWKRALGDRARDPNRILTGVSQSSEGRMTSSEEGSQPA